MVPKREGGEIICTYRPASDNEGRSSSWVRQVASLKGTYEEELFATWPHDAGEPRESPHPLADEKACWTVQYAEACRLETLSGQVDGLLEALRRNPSCQSFVEAVRHVLRNGSLQWEATALPWTYVRQLDRLLHKLTFVYRETKALGGDNAAESVVGQVWPSEKAATDGVGPGRRQNGQRERASHGSMPKDEISAPGGLNSTPSEADWCELGEMRQGIAGRSHTTDPVQEPQEKPELPQGVSKAHGAKPLNRKTPAESTAVPGESAMWRPEPVPGLHSST